MIGTDGLQPWQAAAFPMLPASDGPKWFPAPNYESGKRGRDGESRALRIIVVDDERLIAETVVEILKHEGFEATAVPTGLSAIELAKSWTPDIVLTDVIMPGLNGVETGIRIREVVKNCRVILFSGQAATVDLLEEAREQGHTFEVLAKPVRPEQLVSIIRSA